MVDLNAGYVFGSDSLNKLMQKYLAESEAYMYNASNSSSNIEYEANMRTAEIYTNMAMVAARAMH